MPIPTIIVLAFTMCSTAVILAVIAHVSRHISQRRLMVQSPPGDDLVNRLERIEQTVEATALEVERLAESNRFVARLLAERTEATRL